MNKFKSLVLATMAAGSALAAMPASAITWNTTAGNTVLSNAYGNTQQWTSSGVTVTASAFSTTGSGGSFQTGCLDVFGSNGIGVVSRLEDANPSPTCDAAVPNHAIDNSTSVDGVLFSFSEAIKLTNVGLGYTNNDSDFSVLYYTGGSAPGMAYSSLSNMLTNGWSVLQNVYNGGANNALTNPSTFSQYWYVAAYDSAFGGTCADTGDTTTTYRYVDERRVPSTTCTPKSDYFKIDELQGDKRVGAPEPATLGLLCLGLAGIGAVRRRKVA